jgi:hypothetical protein
MTASPGEKSLRASAGTSGVVERIVAEFAIPHRQYLDATGALTGEPPAFARDANTMIGLYRAMTLTRIFDSKAIALQRTGPARHLSFLRGAGSRRGRLCQRDAS